MRVQLFDFTPALPSVRIQTNAEYISQSWSSAEYVYVVKLMDEQRVTRELPEDRIVERNLLAKQSFVIICRPIYYIY